MARLSLLMCSIGFASKCLAERRSYVADAAVAWYRHGHARPAMSGETKSLLDRFMAADEVVDRAIYASPPPRTFTFWAAVEVGLGTLRSSVQSSGPRIHSRQRSKPGGPRSAGCCIRLERSGEMPEHELVEPDFVKTACAPMRSKTPNRRPARRHLPRPPRPVSAVLGVLFAPVLF
jgi:hypothetical protein